MNRVFLPYNKAKNLIHESDILLFRSHGLISYIIKLFTRSPYSHVGLASWHNGNNLLEIVEFNKFGGSTKILDRVVSKYPGIIDIYRPVDKQKKYKFNDKNKTIDTYFFTLNSKSITNTMRKLTGLPYGYFKIWSFAKQYLLGIRLFYNIENITDDTPKTIYAPVCSTSIAHAFSVNNYDLFPNKSDTDVKPGDYACSPMLNYLFTLDKSS